MAGCFACRRHNDEESDSMAGFLELFPAADAVFEAGAVLGEVDVAARRASGAGAAPRRRSLVSSSNEAKVGISPRKADFKRKNSLIGNSSFLL
jgi:hypothetical protein